MKIVVTGSSGFVGRALIAHLGPRHEVVALSRRPFEVPPGVQWAPLGDLGAPSGAPDWPRADAVVHLAALAHVPAGTDAAARARVLAINAAGPLEAATLAARAGVRRFVFLSSVKALGERSTAPLTEDAPAHPEDLYGEAKLAAEAALRASELPLEVVIVRPPLVYGPGVRANFLSLVRLVRAGWPLPFGAIDNRRSLVSTFNLCAFLESAVVAEGVQGRTLHVTDGTSVSTAELVRLIARGAGRRARLVPLPAIWLEAALVALGRRGLADRLLGSLELSDETSRRLTGFVPPVSLEEGIARTVAALR